MKRAWILGLGVIALGCGSVVVETNGTSSSSSSGNGGAATTSSSSSSTGQGGAISISSSSSGTTTGPACTDTALIVHLDVNGGSIDWKNNCAPSGFVTWLTGPEPPGPGVPGYLSIDACVGTSAPDLTIGGTAQTWPATGVGANAIFDYGDGQYEAQGGGTLDVTTFEPTGGVIEGTFAITVKLKSGTGPATLDLKGNFRVCHGPDTFTI